MTLREVYGLSPHFIRCDQGCFPLNQNLRKFWAEVKWKGPFRFGLTGIFGTTSGGGTL